MADTFFEGYALDDLPAAQGFRGRLSPGSEFFYRAKVHHLQRLAHQLSQPLERCNALDVGCRAGQLDTLLRPHLNSLAAVDLPDKVISEVDRSPDIDYQPFNGHELPFPSCSFDLVFAINAVHYVDPSRRSLLLSELWRVTCRGGLAVVIEHNPLNPLTRRWVDQCPCDHTAMLVEPPEIAAGLESAGATRVHRRYIMFVPAGGYRARTAETILSWCPAGAQYIVWAQR